MANNNPNYISNKQFFSEMVQYLNDRNQRLENGEEEPEIPEEIAHKIMLIAHRLSTKQNFYGYSYRDEMISDGIENAFKYLHKFDPQKSENPFAYFTQVMYNAFILRIKNEQKQAQTKELLKEKVSIGNDTAHNIQESDSGESYDNEYLDEIRETYGFDSEEERRRKFHERMETNEIFSPIEYYAGEQ